jgi:ABC-type transport system involved in multi-copper enzyme maturation permease subunit
MTALRHLFSFPLLGKELTEAAARKRTYVLRVVYGTLLFTGFALMLPRWFWSNSHDPLAIMGSGEEMFQSIIILQLIGVGLFLPAFMCGRIAEEKERDSLVLLFLTDLRPWSILLQKYLGGLVPMFSFLLLALPITATAYAFGGFTLETLLLNFAVVVLACLQVGALALMCSAWFRTTVSALIATYIFAVVFYFGPLLLGMLASELLPFIDVHISFAEDDWLFLFPAQLLEYVDETSDRLVLHSIPVVVSILVFLLLARRFLVRRAFLPPSSFFLRLFRKLDRAMQWANKFFGNVSLLRGSNDLPDEEPIAWREMSRRALGKVHYLVRILIAIEVPVIFLCLLLAATSSGYRNQAEEFSALAAVVGALSILALSVQAANTIVSERVHQTLEVLLTTPMSAREIIAQKARVLRRFIFVLAVPLLTIFAAECFAENGLSYSVSQRYRDSIAIYIAGSLACALIFLPLLSWVSLWIGLKMRTRFKAILTALAVVVGWCAVPVVIAVIIEENFRFLPRDLRDMIAGALLTCSPLALPAFNEQGDLGNYPLLKHLGLQNTDVALISLTLHIVLYGTLLVFIRHLALRSADRYLRR